MLAWTACAGRSPEPEYPAPEPLPALSVQRQLEIAAGYEGEPNTMDPFAVHDAEDELNEPTIDEHPEVQLERFVLAEGVEQREPVGVRSDFAPGARVYAYLHLSDVETSYDLTVRWEGVSGELNAREAQLHVEPSPRYRTWAWMRAPSEPGVYRCIVEAEEGAQVAEAWFDVEI